MYAFWSPQMSVNDVRAPWCCLTAPSVITLLRSLYYDVVTMWDRSHIINQKYKNFKWQYRMRTQRQPTCERFRLLLTAVSMRYYFACSLLFSWRQNDCPGRPNRKPKARVREWLRETLLLLLLSLSSRDHHVDSRSGKWRFDGDIDLFQASFCPMEDSDRSECLFFGPSEASAMATYRCLH